MMAGLNPVFGAPRQSNTSKKLWWDLEAQFKELNKTD